MNLVGKRRANPIYITDNDCHRLSLDLYFVPLHYSPYLDHILIPYGNIIDRVEKLAFDISQVDYAFQPNIIRLILIVMKDYSGVEGIHLICILKGAFTFFNDLTSALRKFHNYRSQVKKALQYLSSLLR